MLKSTCVKQFRHDSKQLATLIFDFLLDEQEKKQQSRKAKAKIDKALDCLRKVYKIGLFSNMTFSENHSLVHIFAVGRRTVTVKNRVAAVSYKQIGNSLMDAKDFDYAEIQYTKAIELDPTNAILFCNRAASRIRQRLLVDAVGDCKKALELDKYYVKAYCWMGLANVLMDNPGKAVRCYRKALRIEPKNLVCVENMDLINKNLNHRVLRVFEPLYRFSRNFFRKAQDFVNNQSLPREKNDGDHVDNNAAEKERKYETEKFRQEKLD